MYVIVKHVKMNLSPMSRKVPVIILNSDTEIWEFDTQEEAEKMKEIFETNSDSGHKYEVKKI
jgi:hypothetical protein